MFTSKIKYGQESPIQKPAVTFMPQAGDNYLFLNLRGLKCNIMHPRRRKDEEETG